MKTENEISLFYSMAVPVAAFLFCFGNSTVYFIVAIICYLILSQSTIQHKLHKGVRTHMLKQIQALDSEISNEEATIAAAKQESAKKAKDYVRSHPPLTSKHLRAALLPKEYKLAHYSNTLLQCDDEIKDEDLQEF